MIVNDLPKFLAGSDITDHTHALTIVDPDVPSQTIILPLALRGVISFLNVRMPTHVEWLSDQFKRLHLTSETLEWDPASSLYEEQELATMTCSGQLARDVAMKGQAPYLVINAISLASLTTDMAAITEDDNFGDVLDWYVQIASFETSGIHISSTNTLLSGHIRSRKSSPIDYQTLAARWRISPDRAKQTVLNTTQEDIAHHGAVLFAGDVMLNEYAVFQNCNLGAVFYLANHHDAFYSFTACQKFGLGQYWWASTTSFATFASTLRGLPRTNVRNARSP